MVPVPQVQVLRPIVRPVAVDVMDREVPSDREAELLLGFDDVLVGPPEAIGSMVIRRLDVDVATSVMYSGGARRSWVDVLSGQARCVVWKTTASTDANPLVLPLAAAAPRLAVVAPCAPLVECIKGLSECAP